MSFRYYAVMYESFISKKMASSLGVLGVVLTIAHALYFSTTKHNITSLERSCLDPNAVYSFPTDTAYAISLSSMAGYNLISIFLVLKIYMYLLNEEKEATCRNRQSITVSRTFTYLWLSLDYSIKKS